MQEKLPTLSPGHITEDRSATAKVVLVTAASRGIGAGCARLLAASGYRVSLLARSASVLSLADELGGIATQGSMTQPEDLARWVSATLDRWGRIDALVLSFGDPPRPNLLEISDELWQETFDLLFLSVVRLARLVTPVMQHQSGGTIVAITASDTQEPDLGTPFSGTLRAAMTGFMKLYSQRYRQDCIRFNAIAPYFVADDMAELEGWSVPDDLMWGRPATYKELAETVLFLLSDAAKFISGTTLKVDEARSAAV